MKVLMIGGTGTISMAITRLLCQSGWEVYLLNRGSRRAEAPAGLHTVQKRSNAANRRTVSRIAHSAGYSIGFIIFKRMASLESKPSFR